MFFILFLLGLTIFEKQATSVYFTDSGLNFFEDNVEKSNSGDPLIRPVINIFDKNLIIEIRPTNKHLPSKIFNLSARTKLDEFFRKDKLSKENPPTVKDGYYDVFFNDKKVIERHRLKFGGVYAIIGTFGDKSYASIDTVTEPNSISMLWLVPQYAIITTGEIMFSVTGLEFAYSQSPSTMKSLLQASWLLTVAFGNLIVVLISKAHFFERRVSFTH